MREDSLSTEMPPKGKKTQNNDDFTWSKENILKIVESQMSDIFETQYEELKDKLITLMAKEVSKLQSKVHNIEQEFETFKMTQFNNATAIVDSNEKIIRRFTNPPAEENRCFNKKLSKLI